MLPVFVFAASLLCADTGTTTSNPAAKPISIGAFIDFKNDWKRPLGVARVSLYILDISNLRIV
jgi:hypothetical protein